MNRRNKAKTGRIVQTTFLNEEKPQPHKKTRNIRGIENSGASESKEVAADQQDGVDWWGEGIDG